MQEVELAHLVALIMDDQEFGDDALLDNSAGYTAAG